METLSGPDVRVEQALDNWAESLILRHGNSDFSLIPFDPGNEYQRSDVVKIGPDTPNVEEVYRNGCIAIGPGQFGPLMGDIKRLPDAGGHPYGAMRQIKSRLGVKNHNVALVTNHVDLMDLAIVQAALYRAMEDDEIAYQSGIIINKALTRVAYHGHPVIDLLRKNGSVYFNLPKSAGKYGITAEESSAFNRRMGGQLGHDLRELNESGKSMLLSVALSGSTVIRHANSYLEIPSIDSPTEKFTLGRFGFILPVSVYLENIKSGKDWYILNPPRILSSHLETDDLMEDLAAETAELSGKPVLYKNFSVIGRSAIEKMFRDSSSSEV